MAPLATRKKILLVNAGAQADKLATASPYLVNTLPTIGDEVKVISKYLAGEGKKQAAILFENDAAGIAGRDDFQKYFPEAGGTILSQEPTQFGQTDYRPALLKLADAKPEVMLVSITAGLLQMAQQYKQLGLKFTVAGTTFFSDPDTIADPSSEGFVHTQVRIDAPPELATAFKAKYGADMEFFSRQLLQCHANHPGRHRPPVVRKQASYWRIHARHAVYHRQVQGTHSAGVQDQYSLGPA